MTRNQVFHPGELPLVLLALLADVPRNGYDLLAELDRLFGPDYRPSPGSVYPALSVLRDEKLIQSDKHGRRAYALTTTGIASLAERAPMLAEIEVRTGTRLRADAGLDPALERFSARVRAVSGRVAPDAVEAELDRAAAQIERLHGARRKRGTTIRYSGPWTAGPG